MRKMKYKDTQKATLKALRDSVEDIYRSMVCWQSKEEYF